MDFALDDNQWQTVIYSKRSVASMRFLWEINNKHHEANYHDLQHHCHNSILASNIKLVWLGCTFWLGSWCILSPNLFWLVHCAFHQNHSNRYTVLCPRVLNCLTQTSFTLWYQFCIGWQPIANRNIKFVQLRSWCPHSSSVDTDLDKWVLNHMFTRMGQNGTLYTSSTI